MNNNSLDIKSSTVDKTLDLVKVFLDKLISPTIEEVGLLMKDKISVWRFNNQIKILDKTRDLCKKNNIPLKSVSLKLLCPYLENASLEETEVLQNAWATLLANLVDARKNIENHVFPYILSQISINEFNILTKAYSQLKERDGTFESKKVRLNDNINIENAHREFVTAMQNKVDSKPEDYHQELGIQQTILSAYQSQTDISLHDLLSTNPLIISEIDDFQIDNLKRLRLVEAISIDERKNIYDLRQKGTYNIDELLSTKDKKFNITLTALGEYFIAICTEVN